MRHPDWPAFVAAVVAEPDDNALRLVAADFLEEHGAADRAAFIRIQVALARLKASGLDRSPEAVALRTQETAFFSSLSWVLRRWAAEDCPELIRGTRTQAGRDGPARRRRRAADVAPRVRGGGQVPGRRVAAGRPRGADAKPGAARRPLPLRRGDARRLARGHRSPSRAVPGRSEARPLRGAGARGRTGDRTGRVAPRAAARNAGEHGDRVVLTATSPQVPHHHAAARAPGRGGQPVARDRQRAHLRQPPFPDGQHRAGREVVQLDATLFPANDYLLPTRQQGERRRLLVRLRLCDRGCDGRRQHLRRGRNEGADRRERFRCE
ncbi:MAG: TIGR02996 domain-containing protein [Planctomycetes bacterium]|nr:TIGR02996 domain-containing protein [Planctomycetota bacterium]